MRCWQASNKVGRPRRRAVAADSTGLAEHRRGEWRVLCGMNRLSRRQFRKAHLAVEARAEDRVIYAWHLTTSRRHDGPLLPKLLEQIGGPIGDVLGDGAYASRSNAEYVEGRGG